MNALEARQFVEALNRIQPHVAPVLFDALANSKLALLAVGVGNGQLQVAVTPLAPQEQPQA